MCSGSRTLHSVSFRWHLGLMGYIQIKQAHHSASGVLADMQAGMRHWERCPFLTVAFKALHYLPLFISVPTSPAGSVNSSPHFPFPISHTHQGPSSLDVVFSVPFAW